MLSLARKLFLVLATFLLVITFSAGTVLAQNSPTSNPNVYNSDQNTISTANTGYTEHLNVQKLMIDVMSAMSCQIAGIDAAYPNKACYGEKPNLVNGQVSLKNTNNLGLIGLTMQGIKLTFTPIATPNTYFRDLAQNFGFVKHTYADTATQCADGGSFGQGVGYCQLHPLLQIWSVIRNLAYLGFVIVFMFVGFAIMLRVKLNPNTVVSIQSTIPKIIIALILITFSYAIAGFLVDMMYVSIGVITQLGAEIDPISININNSNQTNAGMNSVLSTIQGDNPISFANQMVGLGGTASSTAHALGDAAGSLIGSFGQGGTIIAAIIGGLAGSKVATALGSGLQVGGAIVGTAIAAITGQPELIPAFSMGGATIAGALGKVIGFSAGVTSAINNSSGTVAWIGYVAAVLILFVGVLISLARLWLTLLMAYITILLDVVFAPFWILLAVVPKSKFTFTSWIKDMIANLAVFPMIIGIFVIAKVFIDAFNAGVGKGELFAPPLVGLGSLNDGANTMQGIIGLGFIFMAPNLLNISRSIFGAPKSSLMSSSIQGFMMGAQSGRRVWGITGGRLFGVDKNGKPRPVSAMLANNRAEFQHHKTDELLDLQEKLNGGKLHGFERLHAEARLRAANINRGFSNLGKSNITEFRENIRSRIDQLQSTGRFNDQQISAQIKEFALREVRRKGRTQLSTSEKEALARALQEFGIP